MSCQKFGEESDALIAHLDTERLHGIQDLLTAVRMLLHQRRHVGDVLHQRLRDGGLLSQLEVHHAHSGTTNLVTTLNSHQGHVEDGLTRLRFGHHDE